MLLIDFYNVVSAAVHSVHGEDKTPPNLETVRTCAVNACLYYMQKLKRYSANTVIAFDGKDNWRSSVFPNYKQQRKKQREKREFDYALYYQSLEAVKIELAAVMPCKCIEVAYAEADDIISVLARIGAHNEPVCIVSSDKDFVHLQAIHTPHPITQFSPYKDDYIDEASLALPLELHVVGGDSGDGIPNIFSDDDVFLVEGKRQKPFTKTKKEEVMAIGLEKYREVITEEMRVKLDRNRQLIDLTKIPQDISDAILQKYIQTKPASGMLMNYLVQHSMSSIIDRFGGQL